MARDISNQSRAPQIMYFQRWYDVTKKGKQCWMDYFSMHVSLVGIFEGKE